MECMHTFMNSRPWHTPRHKTAHSRRQDCHPWVPTEPETHQTAHQQHSYDNALSMECAPPLQTLSIQLLFHFTIPRLVEFGIMFAVATPRILVCWTKCKGLQVADFQMTHTRCFGRIPIIGIDEIYHVKICNSPKDLSITRV